MIGAGTQLLHKRVRLSLLSTFDAPLIRGLINWFLIRDLVIRCVVKKDIYIFCSIIKIRGFKAALGYDFLNMRME